MKSISAIALFTLSTLAATIGLIAQEPAVKANIPFNFTVGEKSMPAGEYTISSPAEHILKIQSADLRYVEMVICLRGFHESGGNPQLVFYKYGDYYFLHRISSPANTSLNLDIASGKVEKRVRAREARLEEEGHILVAAR